ncbi:DUF4317 domain-containing protein [uncultured Oscillibacter sp.]|uniref:DUF4317 domain-containing protein n=1 Tax=uncultured Oscillibacter sp. TaxID=876091 RepID=UPI0025E1C71B|nr:DUF4317 domain-containing protein [uncultured Oscillibacter sp.]
MTEKEIAELRRRFRAEKSNITHVRGCYVNEKREIISQFDQSLALMSQEESGQLLATLRKTLSGTPGKNLLDIAFETRQVAEGEEHRLLMDLRSSELRDDAAVETFFRKAIDSLDLEGNYLILLAHDAYDVPYRSKDGARQDDAGSEVFSYILCSVCPVKLTKEALSYFVYENQFRTLAADWVVSAPETGFLFPAFDERSTNLYNALLYTRDTAQTREAFVDAVFRAPAPMPAAVQQETFHTILGETLSEACSYQVVQAVHERLCGIIEAHRENHEESPLTVSKTTVGQVLQNCGVEAERVEAFEAQYDGAYGEGADLSPRNLVDTKQLELRTPDVTIRVTPGRGDLVETRVIDGARYILIRAEEGVEVNGVQVHISAEGAEEGGRP